MDWDIWRVLSSPKYSVTLKEMEEHWSILDLQQANMVLNIQEELEYRQNYNREMKNK